MPKSALDPETRLLYGDSLRAPSGYRFDAGVATTFSMDFETALAVPVTLALFAAGRREDLVDNPIALLEGAERISGRLAVYADAGQIHAARSPQSRLCSLLERFVVEVAAPRGGSFHPKLWALRFRPVEGGAPDLLRLLVLSRNLTRDRSWDTVVRLDGERKGRPKAANRPLYDLVSALPGLAVGGITEAQRALTLEVADDVRHADWERPEGCEDVSFAVNGLTPRRWQPGPCRRIGVVSPFCDAKGLGTLAALAGEATVLISRPEQLACIDAETLAAFAEVSVLDEAAEREDGEEGAAGEVQGLHAKIVVQEAGERTRLTLGSGNATMPALVTATNVEVFVTLEGLRSRLGGIEHNLGPEGFGRLTRPYRAQEVGPPDPDDLSASHALRTARRALARGGLRLRCAASDADALHRRLWLVPPEGGLPLDRLERVRVWPITLGEGHHRDALQALRAGVPLDLGEVALIDLSRFVAFDIREAGRAQSDLFSTALAVDGMPEERDSAILHWVIDSRDRFFRYLRLLLSVLGDPFAAALAAQEDGASGRWAAGGDDAPLLEEMVRSHCTGDGRLDAIDRFVSRLRAHGGAGRVPTEFLELWDVFRAAPAEAADAR